LGLACHDNERAAPSRRIMGGSYAAGGRMLGRRFALSVLIAGPAFALVAPAEAQPQEKEAAKAAAAPKPASSATLGEIRRLSDAFADVAEKVSPSVVQIEVTVAGETNSPFRWFRTDAVQRGLGSGVIFSTDGAIVTNNHVIEEARSINVRLRDG